MARTAKTTTPRSLIRVLARFGNDSVEHHDGDLYRLDHPEMEKFFWIDHRTPWGDELLGFDREKIIRQHFGDKCRLPDLHAWLVARGINPAHVKDWATMVALLRDIDRAGPTPDADKKRGIDPKRKGWTPPEGYRSSSDITNSEGGPPRSTLQYWEQRDRIDTKMDPSTREKYYPEKWVEKRLKNYTRRKRKP